MVEMLRIKGFRIYPGYLDAKAQQALLEPLRAVARAAPFVQPVTPGGRRMSVRMTAAGQFGWVTDRRGYRYEPRHPDGMPWPPIPQEVQAIWRDLLPDARDPECCLVNLYGPEARMGMHQDRDEADVSQPVLSISLGCDGRFRMGQETKGGPTVSHWLRSGDVVVMEGAARLAFHGVDRIRPGSSSLLPGDQRINLTLRVVT